jgi:hypothetical protein
MTDNEVIADAPADGFELLERKSAGVCVPWAVLGQGLTRSGVDGVFGPCTAQLAWARGDDDR